ncbi:unnamed protein product [Mycena citricolor]|uniref:Uncharacterized protein n=1 Tax=Mycena citricolor TaxID=2018698 RepID=A0AAD2HKL6_9AGAR|nr:unnamed protein product [Mycena citricolor]
MSPPNSARTCSSLRMWLAYVVHAIAPSSASSPPALPLSTLDLGTPQTSTPVALALTTWKYRDSSPPIGSKMLNRELWKGLLSWTTQKKTPQAVARSENSANGCVSSRLLCPIQPEDLVSGGRPSTPCSTRTPLASITNLIRTPTTKHAKSPLSPLPSAASPAESRLSEELEECYKTLDPFSMSSESFFSPDTVHAQVSMGDIGNVRVYEHTPKIVQSPSYRSFLKSVRAVSSKEPRIKETHVYDLMVYNYQSVALVKKRRTPKTGIQVTL